MLFVKKNYLFTFLFRREAKLRDKHCDYQSENSGKVSAAVDHTYILG